MDEIRQEELDRIYARDNVTVIDPGDAARKEYGELWGSMVCRLAEEQLRALCSGWQLAIKVMDEYLLFLEGPKEGG